MKNRYWLVGLLLLSMIGLYGLESVLAIKEELAVTTPFSLELTYEEGMSVPMDFSWHVPGVVANGRLFVARDYSGVDIYDISQPAPQYLTTISASLIGGEASHLAVDGNHLYVVRYDLVNSSFSSVVKLDITDIYQPQFMLAFTRQNQPMLGTIKIIDQRLYVQSYSGFINDVYYDGGFSVYDIGVTEPELIGFYTANLVDPGFMVTADHTVFLARRPGSPGDSGRIEMFDMSVPERPIMLDSWQVEHYGNVVDIEVVGNQVFAAMYWGGLVALNINADRELDYVGFYDWEETSKTAVSLTAVPPYVIVGQSWEGSPNGLTYNLSVFEFDAGGQQFVWTDDIETVYPPLHVYQADDRLFFEQRDNMQKMIDIYRVEVSAPYQNYLPVVID
ncbi:MAG TPA: hypothetical protein VLL52_24540 [Anaerolineae bacterium]|nr:hypothetical protein [Anaerolineae bacterium]